MTFAEYVETSVRYNMDRYWRIDVENTVVTKSEITLDLTTGKYLYTVQIKCNEVSSFATFNGKMYHQDELRELSDGIAHFVAGKLASQDKQCYDDVF